MGMIGLWGCKASPPAEGEVDPAKAKAPANAFRLPSRRSPSDKAPAPPPAAANLPPSPGSGLDARTANALLSRWAEAQNGGDFSAYEALYADKFMGIKRTGAQAFRFDRAGWMQDRKRMFGKPMMVEFSGMRTVRAGETAVLRFEQRWTSGNFQDVGLKQLVLISTPAGLRIAREEMLSSTVASKGGPLGPYGAETLSLLFTVGGERVAILRAASDGPLGAGDALAWSAGVPETGGRAVAALKALSDPALASPWTGKPVRLFGPNGACSGTAGEGRALRIHVPHFGTRDEWKALPAEEHAKSIWDAGVDGQFLAVAVKTTNCTEADLPWATVAGKRVPARFESLYPAEVAGRARDAALAIPAIAEGLDEWRTSAPKDHPLGTAEFRTAVWGHNKKHERIHVRVAGAGGCADAFAADVFLRVAEDGTYLPMGTAFRSSGADPVPFDLDGDGEGEWLSGQSVTRVAGNTVEVLTLPIPNYDCDC